MSFVIAVPEFLSAAATDLANLGSTISAANAAASIPTTGVLAAGADDVSAAIAALFGAHAQAYQTISAQAATFHAQFVQTLSAGAGAYANAEAANVQQSLLNAINAPTQALLGGQNIAGGDETLPYTDRFNDLYTETKVVAERFVLAQNGVDGMLTCAIRPSGIWGNGDQTMFRKLFESVLKGHVKVLVGRKSARLDNSYVHNLIHGFILAAAHLVPDGTAPGQAYFINDAEPINMFEFARPVLEACGQRWPKMRISGPAVRWVMTGWQRLHFRFGFPAPLLEPLAVERLYLDNYFSIAKARRDLGYEPLFTTQQALTECLPYYVSLFEQMKNEARAEKTAATVKP